MAIVVKTVTATELEHGWTTNMKQHVAQSEFMADFVGFMLL